MTLFASLLAGLVFGLGLLVSGMANPAKVIGFLDLAGAWDPSLAFVMVGAIAVGFVAFVVARQRTVSFLGADMKLPSQRRIDRRLIVGSTVFGIGWGVATASDCLRGVNQGPRLRAVLASWAMVSYSRALWKEMEPSSGKSSPLLLLAVRQKSPRYGPSRPD